MRVLLVLALAVAACSPTAPASPKRAPAGAVVQVTEAEWKSLAKQLWASAKACDGTQLSKLVDGEALEQRVKQQLERGPLAPVEAASSMPLVVQWICETLDEAMDVRLVRVRATAGELRAIVRVVHDQGIVHLEIRARRDRAGATILDIYSYYSGMWLSDLIAEDLVLLRTDRDVATKMERFDQLSDADQPAEALAVLSSLPDRTLATRRIQALRLETAGQISKQAYSEALDERARRLPDVELSMMEAYNAAFVRGDFDGALRSVDALDAAVGGDPYLDAVRAPVLLRRKRSGDIERAAVLAERAVKAEPTILKVHWVKFHVAVAGGRWPVALSTLERLESDFGMEFTDAKLRADPNYAGLVASPEYQAWRDRHR